MTGKQKRHLKGLAHSLKPLVNIGKQGISEEFSKQIDKCLLDHELIKVKILESCPLDKKTCAQQLSEASLAEVVQLIGKTIILYRPHPEEPVIKLP